MEGFDVTTRKIGQDNYYRRAKDFSEVWRPRSKIKIGNSFFREIWFKICWTEKKYGCYLKVPLFRSWDMAFRGDIRFRMKLLIREELINSSIKTVPAQPLVIEIPP